MSDIGFFKDLQRIVVDTLLYSNYSKYIYNFESVFEKECMFMLKKDPVASNTEPIILYPISE